LTMRIQLPFEDQGYPSSLNNIPEVRLG
jgi:hypothetical protein